MLSAELSLLKLSTCVLPTLSPSGPFLLLSLATGLLEYLGGIIDMGLSSALFSKAQAFAFTGEVVGIIDGDTIEVLRNGKLSVSVSMA